MIELIVSATLSLATPQAVADDMPERYRKWLEEEAVYIISDDEKRIFRQLKSSAQRDRFKEEFWLQRDPTPGTDKNEFKEEHYKRIDYANKWLGRETAKPGWKTDRGRIYILLGEPKQRRNYYGDRKLVPLELWFYDADPMLGVPPFFYVIFFKKWSVGDLIQYDPTMHGPEQLIFMSAGESFEQAASIIADIDFELAQASISLVPSEQEDVWTARRPSLSSIQLMSQIENIPNYRRDAEYAERILRGDPRVETRFSFDSSNLAAAFSVIKLASGDSTLNYSFFFPAQVLDYGQYENNVYTALEVVLTATTDDGTQVASVERAIDQDITPEQMNNFKRSGLAFEDNLLLLPGDYDVTLTVRNKVARVYYLATGKVHVPSYRTRSLDVGEPVLYDRSESGEPIRPSAIPPFAFYALKFHPILADSVPQGQQIGVFYQIHAALEEGDSVDVTYRLLDDKNEMVLESVYPLGADLFNELGTASVFWRLDTTEIPLGSYRLEISARQDDETAKAISREIPLMRSGLFSEPLINYGGTIDFTGPRPALDKATQLFNLKEYALAASLLGAAVRQWPQDKELASLYADALIETGDHEQAIEVLLEASLRDTQNPDWKRRLGMLHLQTGQYNKAIAYYEQVRLLEGDSVETLNPLGEAYRFAGNDAKAIEIWRRSLDIEPIQPLISSRLEYLQKAPENEER